VFCLAWTLRMGLLSYYLPPRAKNVLNEVRIMGPM
jgi:hypothetical protein